MMTEGDGVTGILNNKQAKVKPNGAKGSF